MNARRLLILALLPTGGLAASRAHCAEPLTRAPVLHLRNGDYLAGELISSADANHLHWKSPLFATDLKWPLAALQSVQFPAELNPAAPQGPYCFELAGGDTLYGSLVSLDAREAVVDAAALGTLHIDRAVLLRFYRTSAADLIFSGPNGLEGWTVSKSAPATGYRDPVMQRLIVRGVAAPQPPAPPAPATPSWSAEGGQLLTKQAGAALRRDFRLPPQARFEIELAWGAASEVLEAKTLSTGAISLTKKAFTYPSFELALAMSDDEPLRGYRLEVWEDDLVAVRETKREADFALVQKLTVGAGLAQLQLYIDQQQGRFLVFSAAGEKLAELAVPPDEAPRLPKFKTAKPQMLLQPSDRQPAWSGGVSLVNRRGDLKLQRLAISRWNGAAPLGALAGQARIHETSGKISAASQVSYDAARQQFVLDDGSQTRRLDAGNVRDVLLLQSATVKPRGVRVLQASGTRLGGDLVSVRDGQITLRCPGIREPLVLKLQHMHSLISLAPSVDDPPVKAREGRLELSGASLRGWLVDAREGEASCLVFQPRQCPAASPLVHGVSGKLVYREPPPPKPAIPQAAARPGAAMRVINGVRTLMGTRQAVPPRPAPATHAVLHLRSGDAINCQVASIDERGVALESTMATAKFVPHAAIKALELQPNVQSVKIDKAKKDRLLTLPRLQRDSPPTQLIRSLEGDYLRGRLLAMDDKQLQLELRLENRAVSRDQVARIIWLHADEITGTPPAARSTEEHEGTRVQALRSSGNRLTFMAQQLSSETLSGTSVVLGVCQVKLDEIDQLLLGPAIEAEASQLAFHGWKLKPAAEPLPTPEGGDSGGGEGLESVLVGKPAPPIEIDFADGKKFRLADYKDKVLILDFWASWCGPCLQAMPQVDKVAHEFADQGVSLVAINLEETPDRVRTALERLKLQTTVALDRDGRVAERYGATAIPQTVIIGRDGKVARLFVGGGARFDEQLRQALKAVLAAETSGSE